MSLACAARPSGDMLPMRSDAVFKSLGSPAITCAVMPVGMDPGAMELARILNAASSDAALRAKPITPALAIAYACGPRPPCTPATEAVPMMQPPLPEAMMPRAACLKVRNTPRTRTAMVLSKSSIGVSAMGPTTPTMPALANALSRRPNVAMPASTAAATSASLLTSH